MSGPTLDLLHQNLHCARSPGKSHTHESRRGTDLHLLLTSSILSLKKEVVKDCKYSLVKQTAMGSIFYGLIDSLALFFFLTFYFMLEYSYSGRCGVIFHCLRLFFKFL